MCYIIFERKREYNFMNLSIFYLNLLHAGSDGFSSALVLLLPFIKHDLNLSLTQVGFLGSSFSVLTIILALPAGSLSVRFGGMRVLTSAVLAYGLGYILLGFSGSFVSVLPLFLLCSAGFALFNPIGYGLIARFSKKETRGKVIGTFSAFGDIGKLILASGITFIVAAIGWRNTSFLYGGIALLFFAFLLLSHYKNKSIHAKQEKPQHVSYITLLKNKRFVLGMASGVLDYMSSYPLFIFLPFVLLQKGVPPALLGPFLGGYFVGNLIGKPFLGRMTDRNGHVKTFICAELLTAAAIISLILSHNIIFVAFLTLALGILGKGTTPVTQTMVTDASEHHNNFEKSIALYSLIGNIAAAFGSIMLGYFSDHFGINNAYILTAVLALSAIIPAASYGLSKPHV